MKTLLRAVLLSGAALLAMPLHAAAQHHSAANDPDMVEVRNYQLSMDKIHRLAGVYEKLEALYKANPGLKKELISGSDDAKNQNMTQLAHEIDAKFPMAAPIFLTGGFSTREFIVASIAVFSDAMIVGMKDAGQIKEYPPNTILPANAALLEQHKTELESLMKNMTSQSQDGDSN